MDILRPGAQQIINGVYNKFTFLQLYLLSIMLPLLAD